MQGKNDCLASSQFSRVAICFLLLSKAPLLSKLFSENKWKPSPNRPNSSHIEPFLHEVYLNFSGMEKFHQPKIFIWYLRGVKLWNKTRHFLTQDLCEIVIWKKDSHVSAFNQLFICGMTARNGKKHTERQWCRKWDITRDNFSGRTC